jgi:hypothetical protein
MTRSSSAWRPPSTLKTVEMLLTGSPNQSQLLLTACSGFTEYS